MVKGDDVEENREFCQDAARDNHQGRHAISRSPGHVLFSGVLSM